MPFTTVYLSHIISFFAGTLSSIPIAESCRQMLNHNKSMLLQSSHARQPINLSFQALAILESSYTILPKISSVLRVL